MATWNPKGVRTGSTEWRAHPNVQTAVANHAALRAPHESGAYSVPTKAALSAEERILGEHTGGPKGSNAGGFYRGRDGVMRYVKFYKDEAQAHGEHLANSLYRDLGVYAPESEVFAHKGRTAYAAKLLDGQTLQSVGVAAEHAKHFMRGFAADVLTGNWDAAGLVYDNAFVLHGGKGVARIDNGGTFLMRAQAGRKPEALLGKITEWDKFRDPSVNHSYHALVKASGFDKPKTFNAAVSKQIRDVVSLRDRSGGWAKYVEKHAPGLKEPDKRAIIGMLEARTRLLQGKLASM